MGKDNIDIFETGPLNTKADKAKAAARLGQFLKTRPGVTSGEAGDAAAHELEHSLADTGQGRMAVRVEPTTWKRVPYYEQVGEPRTDEEKLRILKAPRNMSESDKRKADEIESKRK